MKVMVMKYCLGLFFVPSSPYDSIQALLLRTKKERGTKEKERLSVLKERGRWRKTGGILHMAVTKRWEIDRDNFSNLYTNMEPSTSRSLEEEKKNRVRERGKDI